MKKITRKNAKELGLKRYFTGKSCPNGHFSERYVSGCTCVECAQESATSWALQNKGAVSRISKRYRVKNETAVKDRYAEWYSSNPDYHPKWRDENADSVRASTSKWRKKNMQKVLSYNRNRRARLAGASGYHCQSDILNILQKQNFKCPYCLSKIKSRHHVDHIMPLALGGSNAPENIQCLCPECNVKKQAQDPIVWAKKNGRLL